MLSKFFRNNVRVNTSIDSKAYTFTIAQEETVPNIWNVTMFGDLD